MSEGWDDARLRVEEKRGKNAKRESGIARKVY